MNSLALVRIGLAKFLNLRCGLADELLINAGDTAAKIQKLRKSDPYKGKGIHLLGQRIRRKAGKTGKKA